MNALMIYLMDVSQGVMMTAGILMIPLAVIVVFGLGELKIEGKTHPWMKTALIALFVSWLVFVLTPTKRTMIQMIVIPEIAAHGNLQHLDPDMKKLVENIIGTSSRFDSKKSLKEVQK